MLLSEGDMLQAASQSSVDSGGFSVAGVVWHPVSAVPLIPPTWAWGARASSSKRASSRHIRFCRPGCVLQLRSLQPGCSCCWVTAWWQVWWEAGRGPSRSSLVPVDQLTNLRT